MKNIFLLAALAATLSLSSCLDEHPKDQLPEDAIYTDASSIYNNAVATLYNYIGSDQECEGLQGTCRGIFDYNTLTTDEAMNPIRGGDWYDGGLWQNLYLHRWTADDQYLYNVWKYLYKVIVLSDKSIANIEKHSALLSASQKESYTAEVRAVRAMFYYYAMDTFGRIPILTSADMKISDVKQSERSQVFRFIVNELQDAAKNLPAEHSNHEGNYYGRVTAPVAYFLLAKLALNAEVYSDDNWTDGIRPDGKQIFFDVDGKRLNAWQTCIAYCQKITDCGYKLEPEYTANFSVHNEGSVENIFTIPMNKVLYNNEYHYRFRSLHYAHNGAYGCASENGTSATVSTVKAFGYGTPEQDTRFDMNFFAGKVTVDGKDVLLDNGEPLVYMPLEMKLNLTDSKYMQTAGARIKKYEIDRSAYSDGKMPDNDIVLFRYADVLLMQAEAKVRNGKDASAELHAIRSRVGMPDRPATLDNILAERRLEFVWEGWRRQDMIRFGIYNKAYDERPQLKDESNGYTTVFPIPNKCISLNSNYKQNPGYGK